MPDYKYKVQRTTPLPSGGSVTVTVSQPDPIDERDYLFFRPTAAIEIARCFVDLANGMRRHGSKEIVL
jgi:hypothetical protein